MHRTEKHTNMVTEMKLFSRVWSEMVWTECTTNMVTKDDSFYLKLYQFVCKIINYKKSARIQIARCYRDGNQEPDFLVAFFILRTQVDTNTSVPTILKHRGTTTYRS